ncbi:hypothetical protein BGW80DRAFT_5816 [Lactifluus volemus]|nr:hypothetical protein BGW80DRAFT_5816 [Lactifluus volemus]
MTHFAFFSKELKRKNKGKERGLVAVSYPRRSAATQRTKGFFFSLSGLFLVLRDLVFLPFPKAIKASIGLEKGVRSYQRGEQHAYTRPSPMILSNGETKTRDKLQRMLFFSMCVCVCVMFQVVARASAEVHKSLSETQSPAANQKDKGNRGQIRRNSCAVKASDVEPWLVGHAAQTGNDPAY